MSVSVWTYANHNIDFDQPKDSIVARCIEILKSIGLPGRKWKFKYVEATAAADGSILLEYIFEAVKIKRSKNWRTPKEYYDVAMSRNYLQISTSCFKWVHWVNPTNDEEKAYRDKWNEYIHELVHAFGGDKILYFPDSVFDKCKDILLENCNLSFNEWFGLIFAEVPFVYNSIGDLLLDEDNNRGAGIIVERV